MTLRGRCLFMVLTVALILAPVAASARDQEFSLLVHHIESHYHAHHAHGVLLAFAGFAIKIARPYGVKNCKLAMFENQDFSVDPHDLDFASVVRAGLQQGWQPLVQVYSRRNAERTYVFAKYLGEDVKLLIATLERKETVVLEVKFNPEKLDRYINHQVHGD